MNLKLTWDNPVPLPDCGFRAEYRRKGEQVAYSQVTTSGTTSATTSTYILVDAPANYEGAVYADCCSGSTSAGDPFGVNAYVELQVALTISGSTFTGMMFSDYANPYDVLATVTINYHIGPSYSVYNNTSTYPAGTTLRNAFSAVIPGIVVDSYSITNIAPIFNNGGQLQQYDPVNTPGYFQFYNGSIAETSGSPIAQPSFTLDAFIVTERDTSNNPTAGNLLVSWAQGSAFAGGVNPYDNYSFSVIDASGSTIGTATLSATINGLRELTIPVQKNSIALDTSHQYTMKVEWDNGATIGSTKVFYLPDFS